MTVRRLFAALLVAALLAGAGCGERSGAPLPAEIDEVLYVQGMQLKRQGRHQEALGPFLKVIEKRGSRGAAESHLEAGVIYLQHVKDPVEAYHHFRRYLDLEPKSKQADFVRGQVQAALREFAKSIPGRPLEAQTARLEMDDELIRLRRENDNLRAELTALRNAAIAPLPKAAGVITLPDDLRAVAPPVQVPAAETPATATPRREAEPTPVASKSASSRAAGRTHTVKQGDSLFRIGQKYGVKADAIAAANRDLLPAGVNSKLSLGMELKIP